MIPRIASSYLVGLGHGNVSLIWKFFRMDVVLV